MSRNTHTKAWGAFAFVLTALIALTGLALPAHAATIFQNKWKNTYLNFNGSTPVDGQANNTDTIIWELEDAGFENYVRLRSIATGEYLHVENGSLEVGSVEPGWWSAMWQIEKVDGDFVRLQNRWKPTLYINNEMGDPVAGPIEPGWWSAQWKMLNVELDTGASSGSSSGGSSSAPSSSAPTANAGDVSLIIENRSSAPLDIFVDDASGQPAYVMTIEPGYQAVQPTPVGRIWRLAQDDEWVGGFEATDEPEQLIQFP